jgi:hypothetical protein
MSAMLFLAPIAATADSTVIAEVTYLGNGAYQIKNKPYGYDALVAKLQATHAGEHIDVVVVNMGTVTSELEKQRVCQLRQSLQTRVKMELTVDGDKHELFCT